jgi:hypothetical protein
MSPLEAWANFYVIVGSSAGALIGLMFVVVTLMSGRQTRAMTWGLATFNTPTIVHFTAVLFVAAILSAPWPARWEAAVVLGAGAVGGLGYGAIVLRRLINRGNYDPVIEDWLFFALLPLLAYGALLVSALLMEPNQTLALFIVGGALLLMILIGIHNAWDLVTWIASGSFDQARAREAQSTTVEVEQVSKIEEVTEQEEGETVE